MENKECQIEYSRYDGYDQITDGNGEIVGFVDKSTGEAMGTINVSMPPGSKVDTPQSIEKKKQFAKRDWRRRKRRTNNIGGFIMATCRERQFETIAPQDTARLVYLASYMDNDGILRKNKSKFIRHSDLSDLLQLSRTAVFHFWNAVKDKFIVELPTGELKILDCFFKGPLHGDNGRLTKIFIKNVRQLYTATPTRQHVYLGYFFQVLYHINVEYNILCKNPYEDSLDDVEPMTIQEFCRMMEYDVSKAHRLRKACDALCFSCNGRVQHLCAFVTNSRYINGEYMILNPNILYAGTDYEAVEVYGLFFK